MSSVPFSPELPRRRFTVDEVLRMVDDGIIQKGEPLELLEGELIVVSPQGPRHTARLGELQRRLQAAYGEEAQARCQMPIDLRPYNMPEPDVAVVRGAHADYLEHHPRPEDTLLVVEVAWTSQYLDHKKAIVYGRAGVPVYWLWDLAAGRLEVLDQPSPGTGYQRTRLFDASAATGAIELPGLAVSWRLADLTD